MKNIDDTSREDNISQLFIKNSHKLDEAPSGDLWSRIETKLDSPLQQSGGNAGTEVFLKAKSASGIKRMLPYLAAAAVLLLFVVAIPLLNRNASEQELAEKLDAVEDVELPAEISEALPVTESDKDSAFEIRDNIQKEKMIESAKKAAGENKKAEAIVDKYGLDRVEINTNSDDLIVLTTEPAVEEEDKSFISRPRSEYNDVQTTGNSANNANIVSRSEYQNSGRAYADPPMVSPTLNDKLEAPQKKASAESKKEVQSKPIMKSKSSKKDHAQRLEGRMQIFEWLLGQWTDEEEEGGKAFENWRWVNGSTIECLGSKMKGSNKIFEEKLTIYFDPALNQVFMKMPVDDYKKTALYMLTAYDTERIVFEQKEDQSLPNKVIFQRNLNGFSTIITFDQGFIKPAQQSYFEQRNRVSNTKALRILTPADR